MRTERILVVEKDEALRIRAAGALEAAGYEVIGTADAMDGLRKLYEKSPDLIIVAGELPMVSGEDAYLRIRQASYLPIIVMGSRGKAAETLELGADAYIVKPPSGREVVARVHSLLRRRRDDRPEGGGRPGIESYLPGGGDPEGLSPTECRLGSCLLSNEGKLLGYPQLITEVWGGKEVSVDTLHFYIRRLRRKLANFRIFGMRGIGYGFSGGSR